MWVAGLQVLRGLNSIQLILILVLRLDIFAVKGSSNAYLENHDRHLFFVLIMQLDS